VTPASSQHGAASRRPVYSGNRRVPLLGERTLKDGSIVFEAALRTGRRRLEARTKTDAIAEVRALQVDLARGELHRSPAVAPSVADYARDSWLPHLESRIGHRDPRRRYSARTVALTRQRVQEHINKSLGHLPMNDVAVADVRRLIDRLGTLAPSTATGIVSTLSALCQFAVKNGVLERNPVRDLDRDDRPGVARQSDPRRLTEADLQRLLGNLSDVFRPIAYVCAFAGLRVSEALGLQWRDVDIEAGTLTVTAQLGGSGDRVPAKTAASTATVPLLPALARELKAHRARQASRNLALTHGDALVFTTLRGKPQSRRNALRAVHAAGDAAGLNEDGRERVGLHDLRHTFISMALAKGVSLPQTAALARASVPVVARVYAGITEEGRAEAAAKLVEAGFGA